MLWGPLLVFAAGVPDSVTPADTASSSLTTYFLGYGPLGIAVLAMAWLSYKGWRLVSPSREAAIRKSAREDLVSERDRLIAENRLIRRQLDDAMRIARDQLMPLLVNFTAATQSLLPILQSLASQGMWPRHRDSGQNRGGPE